MTKSEPKSVMQQYKFISVPFFQAIKNEVKAKKVPKVQGAGALDHGMLTLFFFVKLFHCVWLFII